MEEKVEETQAFRGFKIWVCENMEENGGVEIGEESGGGGVEFEWFGFGR